MKHFKPLYLIIFILGIVLVSLAAIKKNRGNTCYLDGSLAQNNSFKADSFQILIDEYCKLNKSIDSLGKIIDFKKASDKDILGKIEKLNRDIKNDSISRWTIMNTFRNDSLRKPEIARYDSLTECSVKKMSILEKLVYGKEIEKIEKERDLKYSALKNILNNLRTCTGKIVGSRAIVFYGVKYHLFVADMDSNKIRIHLMHNKSKSSLGNVKAFLELQKTEPLMITNAGMYTPSYEPEGLYIEENSTKKYSLDMGSSNLGLNFYLKPNGVFYIDKKNIPHIDSTQEYARLQKSGKLKVKMATQSGPMLVINGRIHPAFTKGSVNRKIRSGVGIINDKKVVFAITLDGSNFYDFGIFLRDVFNCKNALFLDGAISRMYLHDIDSMETGGEFGPIISVSGKSRK